MTGNSDTQTKLRAVFLAFVMVTSVFAVTVAFSGSAVGATTADGSPVLGAADQSITQSAPLTIEEDAAGDFGSSGSAAITVPDPVTFNQSASNLQVRQTSEGSLSNVRFTDEQTLEFDYSGLNPGDTPTTVIEFGSLSVDVPTDTGSDFDVTARVGTVTQTATITTNTPSFVVDSTDSATPSSGAQQVGAASTSDAFSVELATATADGQVAAGSNIVINANASNGVTFDTSLDATDGGDLTYTGATAKVDTTNASISQSGDQLTIPVTDDFSAGDSIIVQGLQVNATADASDSQLTAETTPVNALSSVTASSAADIIDVTKPTVDLGSSVDVAAGADSEPAGTFSADVTSSSNGDIADGTNVTLVLNNSDVTFDESASVTASVTDNSGDGGESAGTVEVNEDSVTVSISDSNNGALEATDVVTFSNLQVNTTSTVADETTVQVSAQTEGTASDTTITSSDSNNFINVLRPDLTYTGDSVEVDNDGVTGASVSNIDIASAVSGDIAGDTNVTVSIASGSGVTFDQSASVSASVASNAGGDGASESAGTVEINENNVTVSIADSNNGELEATDVVTLSGMAINASGSATNTTLAVTTNTSDSEVTTELDNQIEISGASPGNIAADADVTAAPSFGANGADVSYTGPEVTNTVTSAVRVQNGGNFGGATVDLEIVEAPESATGQSLNTTQVTTDSNGEAAFNFTAGDVAGDYVVNASVQETGAGVNITYTATAGQIAAVTVTPIENAIAGDSSEVGDAAVYINGTDANGNPVDATTSVEVTADNVGAAGITAYDDVNAAGEGVSDGGDTANPDNLNDGTFDLDSNDGSSVLIIDSDQVEDVTITATVGQNSDSGTVTFFNEVGQVDLELNETTVAPGETVSASATIAQEDGTTITVPDVSVDFDNNNSPNSTLNSASADTNTEGVASVTVTADQAGTSTIDAVENLKSDSVTLTIEEPQVALENVSLDPSTVEANTTNDHTLTFEAIDVSDDGNTDEFTVTIPNAATLESANSLSVTDANGDDVSLSGGPDVSGNTITFDVAPDSGATTRALTVTANVTVSAPDVSSETTANITIDVSDSNNGQDSANATLTVQPVDTATATVTFDNKTVQNGTTTLTVESANLSEGGFIVIHSTPVVPNNGTALDSVLGNSDYLAAGQSENITVTLDEPLTENQTLVAMAHQDTNDNQTYDFVTSGGQADGPYTSDGSAVVDSADITIQTGTGDALVDRFGGGDGQIDNIDVLNAVNAANSGGSIGGEPVTNLDVLQLVNRVNNQ